MKPSLDRRKSIWIVVACVMFVFWLLLSGKFEFKFLFYRVLTAIVSA